MLEAICDRFLRFGFALLLITELCGLSWAETYDFNPAFEGSRIISKYTYECEDDVQGEGYMMVRKNTNTNNLSLMQFMHGSGVIDYSDKLNSKQKTTHTSDYYYIINEYGSFEKRSKGANSEINYTIQNSLIQKPYTFGFGTGWFAVSPVNYDSLLKEKTIAKSYQEATMMHHQLDYARGYDGDIAVNMNCTGPTVEAEGKGLIGMRVDGYVTSGMVHIGELVSDPSRNYRSSSNSTSLHALKNPIMRVDANYIGTFHIKKDMTVEMRKPKPKNHQDWLPCCFSVFSDMPAADLKPIREEVLFDCTCAE